MTGQVEDGDVTGGEGNASDCPLPGLQFAEKFQEVKEAARLAREKSQDGEFTSSALALASHQVGISAVCLYCPRFLPHS